MKTYNLIIVKKLSFRKSLFLFTTPFDWKPYDIAPI